MKKSVETAASKAVAAAAAAAAAASLVENVDLWAQQDWIKSILSKSGTEMKEVPAEDLCKMVYYSGLPLLMTQQQQQQQQQQAQQQQQHGSDSTILQLSYNDANSAEQSQYVVAGQPARNGTSNSYQQQHHTISLTNGLTISNGPQSSSSSSSSSSNGQLTIVLNPPAQGMAPAALPVTYAGSISPVGDRGRSASPEQPAYPGGGTAPSSKFRCDQCNISFGSKSAHTSHMKSHAKQQQAIDKVNQAAKLGGEGPITVTAGGGTGGGSPAQQPDPYQCDVCKKTFAVPARLVRHYRTHTGERPFECEFCHKMFSVKENLQVHRRIHTKERPYKCEICGRAFEHSGKLHRHMRIHTGERPHKCNVCGKTFIQSGQLVIHMRTHTGEKPYKCPVEGCGKGFTCSKQLKVHSRTHTGEKPYHCDICFRDFGYNHVLKLHRVQHYGAKCYKCTICDETFKSKKEMEAHIKGHANELPDDEETAQEEGGSSCKLEDVSGPEGSAGSSNVDGGLGSGSNSNSSFDYSSSVSHTESGLEQGPSSDEPSRGHHFAIMKSTSPSPPSMGTNDDAQQAEEENEEDEEGMEDDRKQVPSSYEGITMHTPFDQSLQRGYGGGGVAPALLAAASIAAAVENGCTEVKFCPEIKQQQRSISPMQPASLSINRITPPPSSGSSSSSSSSSSSMSSVLAMPPATSIHGASSTLLEPASVAGGTTVPTSGQFVYEPLAIMKHHGYFAPASQITQFRSSSDIVRQVEAAIAGTENLLTPPRSSPESPDRSSSPESDSVLMANRDNNTLPPRKRKLYFKDSQQHQSQVAVPSVPKMASLDIKVTPQQHYTVAQQHLTVQQQQPLEPAHSGHQQLFHPQTHPQHYHDQVRTEQQQAAAAPPPQTVAAPSVIRMSSVIQYANKSS